MAVYNIYHKDGSQLKDSNGKGITVHSIEYNGTWMGECFVTVTFENEAPISFSIGDYIEYRGERFEINYDPGKIKCASKDSYGGAFRYDSVKFNALSDELVRCDMLDLVLYDNQLHYTALPQFSFYVESLDDLLDRIQANLDELYGKASWKLYSRNKERSVQRGGLESEWNSIYGEGTIDNVIDSTSISISDQTCWDALSLVNSQFDVNFIVRNRNVYVGTAGMPTTNIFKYGKGEGLYEIEQNSESDQMIVTRLRAYGSNRNLPNHYYADLGGIPFLNITGDYHEGSTDNGLSVMMEDSTYAGMFTYIISDNGSNMKHCRIRGSIGGYEFDGTLELVKKDSLKSTTRLLAEGKEVCDAIKAKIDSGIVEVDFLSGANKAKFDGNRINYVSNLPNNMACDRLMLPGFPNKTLKEWWDAQTEEKKAWLNPSGKKHIFSNEIYRPYVDSLNIEKIGVRPSSVFFDQDDKVNGIVEIYPTIEEMEVDGVRIDEIYTGTNVEDDGRFGDGETVANVDIYLSPKINFDIRGLMQDDFTIHMKDGMCAGREFKIAGCTKQTDGSWRLTIERQPDDSLNLYFPYNDFQIKKGDHFVLSGIELPDAYVEAASEKLLKYCIAYLDKNDYTRYVYQPKVDEIFMARQHDTAMADASGLTKSLYLTLKEGDIMLFKDDDLSIDAEITIDQLTIKEEDGKIPTYEITLREEKEVGTIQKIQNQISSIVSGNGGAGTTGGGLSTAQIKNLIDSVGSDRFLSKLNPDTAAGIITFLKGTNWGSFTSETGAAMTVDPTTGQTYMEVDRLKVRLKAFFEQLEVQKVGYVGGKIVVSKGQGVDILDVEEIYDSEGNLSAYRCYFLGEQEGRKIDNLLRVKDQMICKDFNVSEGTTDGATNKYYWRLATAVSSDVVKRGNNVCHWVDLSATDCDTNSDIPEIGDTICHLGNREDTDRQGAEILSVVDANSPSFTIYSGINSYSLVNKEYIDMGVVNGKAYCNIYGSTYIGDRDRKSGYLRWNDDKKTFEIKGTIDITSPLSSGGTIGGAIDNAANAYKGEFDAFTSNVNEVIGGFQAQIDGVIETWFYEPEPTLGNEPAVNWTDNATKDKHLGDLYYSKEGKAYRFQKDGDNYVWQIITDTDITKALEEAKKANDAANAAQGTADSKMRVFVVQPTADDEYSVGDMWVNATYPADGSTYSNEILKCKEGKAAGAEFRIAHWEKASKYTDDTKANEALTKVGDLQTDVTELGESFDTLTDVTLPALSDGIITTSEKENIRQALMQVQKECVDVINAYTKLTVDYKSIYDKIAADVRTNFATAYTNLMGSATLSSDGTITYTSGQGGAYGALVDNINTLLDKKGNLTTNEIATINNNIANFNIKYNDFQNRLVVVRNDIEKTLDTRITEVDEQLGGYAYLKKIVGGKTTIDGGLVLTTMLGTGYEVTGGTYKIMSGISGLYETAKSVAIWAGGSMIDKFVYYDAESGKFNVPDDVNPANFLVRMDGTGYAAGGNFWWDNDGKIHADPQSFLINEQYVGNVIQLFQLHYREAGNTAFTNVDYVTPTRMFNGLELSDKGLQIGDTAKLYIKNGVLFIDGDLAVTGGITMYASDGVKSGMIDQVYAVLDQSLFSIKDGVITITGEIGGGTVKAVKIGSTQYDPDSDGIISLPEYTTATTVEWDNILNKPSSFIPSAHTHAISEITNLSSASVNYASSAGNASTAYGLLTNNTSQSADSCYDGNPGLHFYRYNGTSSTIGQSGGDGWILQWSWGTDSVGGQIYLDDNPSKTMCIRGFDGNSTFTTWDTFLHSGNYNSYAPTLTGGGASGTWGISISGNSATSTKSSYARGILGRSTSGGDYGASDDNIVIAEWNTYSDSRWYLKAKGVECRVGYANSAGNADTLDGNHASAFALSGHTHSYLPLSGGYVSGQTVFQTTTTDTPLYVKYSGNTYIGFSAGSTSRYLGCLTDGTIVYNYSGNNYPILHSANYSSYALPLSGGTMNSGARISHGGNMYLGRADNSGWVMCQDICSQNGSGDSYWSLRVDGSCHVKNTTILGTLYVSSTVKFAGLEEGTSTVTDNTEILTSWASNNGFADSSNVGGVYRRDAIHLYNYIKGKTDSVYLPKTGGTISGNLVVNGWIFGYRYSTNSNAAAFIFDKPGSYYTGIGSGGTTNTIRFSACSGDSTWVGYSQIWQFYGDVIANGGITMYSDLRKKNVISDEVLSVKEIAAAPLFAHTYKSDENHYLHIGTSAQYWSAIHEGWFTRKDGEGYYQMELQNLGVAMGISLAREIVTFEGAFKKYESKTDKKIRLMKKKINDLEARIKELEGSREERRTA